MSTHKQGGGQNARATMKTLLFLAMISIAHAGNNVLLIIADDFGTDSQSLYNTTVGATAPTPNINSLAASGVRFTNAYATPVCSSTRACILTGRLGFRTGVGEVVSVASGNSLPSSELTLPEVITQNSGLGIQSACFGKWHLSAGPGTPSAPNSLGGWPHYAGSTGGVLTSYTSWSKTINGVTSTVTLDSKSLKPILSNQSTGTRTRLYTDQFDQSAPTVGGRILRDDRYKIIRLNTGTDSFYDLLTDPVETTNLLAAGIAAMSASHQAFYYRLRFNLGSYTNATAPPRLP